ncbi:MAG: hypothetical protein LBT92_01130 [Rickettsiales bacterium]|nr:hypothetical protein [Rickettsiales bacterium]
MKKLVLIAALSACTSAGPYVTYISSDGNKGIVVEKCMVRMSAFTNAISNDSCTAVQIRLH